jgi:hypothetical protein
MLVLAAMCGLGLAAPNADADVTTAIAGGELSIVASGDAPNVVTVAPGALGYTIYNDGSAVIAGEGCQNTSAIVAVCSGFVLQFRLVGGDGTDVFDLEEVAVPVTGDGGADDDAILGGSGPNTLSGGTGVDELQGGASADRLDGGPDQDLLIGREEADTELGGDGADILRGGSGSADVLIGGNGPDLLEGGAGNDIIDAGNGSDVLVGGQGRDSLAPGTGNDSIVGRGDTVSCGGDASADCVKTVPAPPAVWPPVGVSARAARDRAPEGWPVHRGQATAVEVHVEDARFRKVRVCINTYAENGVGLDAYHKRVTTNAFPKVHKPRPNRDSWSATVKRHGRCRVRHR